MTGRLSPEAGGWVVTGVVHSSSQAWFCLAVMRNDGNIRKIGFALLPILWYSIEILTL